MKLKLRDLRDAQESLKKLLNQDVPARVAFQLSKLARAANAELTTYGEIRQKLVRKYGKAIEGTGQKNKSGEPIEGTEQMAVSPEDEGYDAFK